MTKFENSWGIHTGGMDTPTILKFSDYTPTCL